MLEGLRSDEDLATVVNAVIHWRKAKAEQGGVEGWVEGTPRVRVKVEEGTPRIPARKNWKEGKERREQYSREERDAPVRGSLTLDCFEEVYQNQIHTAAVTFLSMRGGRLAIRRPARRTGCSLRPPFPPDSATHSVIPYIDTHSAEPEPESSDSSRTALSVLPALIANGAEGGRWRPSRSKENGGARATSKSKLISLGETPVPRRGDADAERGTRAGGESDSALALAVGVGSKRKRPRADGEGGGGPLPAAKRSSKGETRSADESEMTSNSRAGEIGGADPADVNANANPRTIPTPVPVDPQAHASRLKPKTAYTNTTLEPHPYTTYIPVPDPAPPPQNQDIQTLPLLTPAERAWLAAQYDLAREPDYWRPVRWLELGERMYGEALKRGTLHDWDDERDGERGTQGGRETQGIAKGIWHRSSCSFRGHVVGIRTARQ
ncbi:hypothetical protein K438DRAFT_1940227 [Mycena galopus ATCC 62051]|nr:hypothetical protein K438DRAFT_1940227 [Mycena galopus ATCC 62051]